MMLNMKKKDDTGFQDFELRLYESAVRGNPNNIPALSALGSLYTRMSQLEKALEIDKRLVTLIPEDSVCHYNLACSFALMNQPDKAFNELEMAILLGYNNLEHMLKDPDFNSIRNDLRFQEIAKKLSSKPS
ncbi:MAG: tetratricopeptide repeat protein [Candidatus Brocadiia bacterium]